MNTDKELLASEKQAITSTPLISTDSILMTGNLGADRTRNLRAIAQIETPLSGGSGTAVTVDLIEADNAALTTNVVSLASSGAVATATANTNRRLLDIPLPKLSKAYVGFRYTAATGAYGAGTITAGFVVGSDSAVADYPTFESHGF